MDENRMNSRELSDDQLEEVAGGVRYTRSKKINGTNTVMTKKTNNKAGSALFNSQKQNRIGSALGTVTISNTDSITGTKSNTDTSTSSVTYKTIDGIEFEEPPMPC